MLQNSSESLYPANGLAWTAAYTGHYVCEMEIIALQLNAQV